MPYSFWVALCGSLAFAGSAGLLSPIIILKRESFLGDVLAHTALVGVLLTLSLPGAQNELMLFIGGSIAAALAHTFLILLRNQTPLDRDLALAVTLALAIGLALVLLTALLEHSSAMQSGERSAAKLRRYLLGSPASLHITQAWFLGFSMFVTLAIIVGFYKLWLSFCFDPLWSSTIGFSALRLELLFKGVFIMVIMLGILSVGALMVTALLVAPGIAAHAVTGRLWRMIALSVCFSWLSMFTALTLGAQIAGLPEGPLTVSLSVSIAIAALLLRGWRQRRLSARLSKTEVQLDNNLK